MAELHAGVQIWTKKSPSNQNLPYIMLKTKSPFLSASTSRDTKTLTLASSRNFESCMSIRCFPPQHILQFFLFCRGFFLRLWELCPSLCRPPLSDRDKKKKKKCLQRVSFPGKSWSIVSDTKRRRNNLLAWGKLFANPYELNSRIWVWEEYNHVHFERICKVCRFDRFLSNFAKTS